MSTMIKMEDLEITPEDGKVITEMYRGHLRETRGYTGVVICMPNGLYSLHKRKAKEVTRMWIKIAMFDARQ